MQTDNQYTGKQLLILGGAVQCVKVVEAAKEMGVYTIVADQAENSPAKKLADQSIQLSVLDVDGLTEWINHNPVDGVLNYCIDYAQMTHQRLCERFGLACFGTFEQYRVLNEKRRFKEFCASCEVDTVPEYSIEDVKQGNVDYPILIKPSDSSGSRGISICNCEKDVKNAIDAAVCESKDRQMLIERYMGDCRDFSVTYLMAKGKAHLIRTGDRFLGDKKDGLDRQAICTMFPSSFSRTYVDKVHPKVKRMLEKLGIQNGPVFLQGFIDGETVRFYDPGIRFPGGEYDRIFQKATGIRIVQMMVAYALGGSLKECNERLASSYLLNGKRGISLCIDAGPGTIAEYDFDRVEEMDEVIFVARKAGVGSVIPRSGDVKQRIAEVVLLVDNDLETIRNKIREVQSKIVVRNPLGESLIVSEMNEELVT